MVSNPGELACLVGILIIVSRMNVVLIFFVWIGFSVFPDAKSTDLLEDYYLDVSIWIKNVSATSTCGQNIPELFCLWTVTGENRAS